MKITAIISEYNPFHNGHLYQINEIKKSIPGGYIVAIMSGNFVQRGEPSLLDKYKRAEFAINNGVDLVIQLPTIYSIQSAENFALGGLKIIKAINCINYLSFGIETSNFNDLYNTALAQYKNKSKLTELINMYMYSGRSYASAYKMATLDLIENNDDSIFLSNSILALEYLKSSFKLNLNLDFLPIQRLGNNYLDESTTDEKYNSATSIRNSLFTNSSKNIKNSIPSNVIESILKYDSFSSLEDYFEILRYSFLVSQKDFSNITGYENGLDNLLYKNILKSNSISDLIKLSISKRYKKSRIQRYLINCLLNIDKSFVDEAVNTPTNHIKILGFNDNGKKIIRKIKENSNVSIVTKNKDFLYQNKTDAKLFNLEKRATDLYNIKNTNNKREHEFKPYIKTP